MKEKLYHYQINEEKGIVNCYEIAEGDHFDRIKLDKVGTARCHKADKFDVEFGKKLAKARLLGHSADVGNLIWDKYRKKEYKVGDRVLFTRHGFEYVGTILEIDGVHHLVEVDDKSFRGHDGNGASKNGLYKGRTDLWWAHPYISNIKLLLKKTIKEEFQEVVKPETVEQKAVTTLLEKFKNGKLAVVISSQENKDYIAEIVKESGIKSFYHEYKSDSPILIAKKGYILNTNLTYCEGNSIPRVWFKVFYDSIQGFKEPTKTLLEQFKEGKLAVKALIKEHRDYIAKVSDLLISMDGRIQYEYVGTMGGVIVGISDHYRNRYSLKTVDFKEFYESIWKEYEVYLTKLLDLDKVKTAISFGVIVEALKEGKSVKRKAWDFCDGFVKLQVPDEHSKMTSPYFYMVMTVYNSKTTRPYQFTAEDILADDWGVIL